MPFFNARASFISTAADLRETLPRKRDEMKKTERKKNCQLIHQTCHLSADKKKTIFGRRCFLTQSHRPPSLIADNASNNQVGIANVTHILSLLIRQLSVGSYYTSRQDKPLSFGKPFGVFIIERAGIAGGELFCTTV